MNTTDHLAALTGIRFVAAGLIVWLHLRLVIPSLPDPGFLALGVSFFFVLSGFILAHNYRALERRTVGRFLVARVTKIVPLHWFTLTLVILLSTWPPFLTRGIVVLDGCGTTINALLLHAWYPTPAFVFALNGVSWTLSNELFFYLLFPLLYLYGGGPGKIFVIWLVFFVLSGLIFPFLPVSYDWKSVYQFLPIYRLGEFLLGLVAYEVYLRYRQVALRWREMSILQIALLAGIMYSATPLTHAAYTHLPKDYEHFAYWILLTSGALPSALLILALTQRGVVADLLATRPFVLLGEISFATYMLHYIILSVFCGLDLLNDRSTFWSIALYFAAVYGLSYGAWRFIELPSQNFLRGTYRRLTESCGK